MLFLLVAVTMKAQRKGLKLQSVVQAGLLEGEAGSALQLQAIERVRYRTWSAGIGAGLDYYGIRTIPLFLDIRKAFGSKEKTAFVYADGGYNFPWLREKDKLYSGSESKGGLYYEAGIGYQLPVLKGSGLTFSAGYSYKGYQMETGDIICPFIGPCYNQTSTIIYRLRRLSVKAGLRF